MAAVRSTAGSESSEECEEDQGRFREAAWEAGHQREGDIKKRKLPSGESSIRQRVQDHWQGVNELQTTPEFRAHVAKKLGVILDNSITVLKRTLGPVQNDTNASKMDDDGFRLFTSSVPGDSGKLELPALGNRQRQLSSSSDLDSEQEWQRCQEAAVSAADILKASGFQATLGDSREGHGWKTMEPNQKKKKKKRRRKSTKTKVKEENGSEKGKVETAHDNLAPHLNGANERGRSIVTGDNSLPSEIVVVKKKKKPRGGNGS